MENKNELETFSYTYSPKEQEEIRRIREKYIPKEASKMEQLRILDRRVTNKGTRKSIIVGVAGALLLGTGMSAIMTGPEALFVPGLVIGVIGLAVTAAAYPVFIRTIKAEREKIAPEIIRLTDELMK